MSTTITLSEKIIEFLKNPGEGMTFIIVFLLSAGFVILVHEHKTKLWKYVTNRRNKWYVAFSCFTAAFLILSFHKQWIQGIWCWIITILWIIYTFYTLIDLKPLDFISYRNPILKRYKKYLYEGTAYEHIGFFENSDGVTSLMIKYLFSATDRLEYYMLKHSYYSATNDYETAYKALQSMDEATLYEGPKAMNLRKAYCLALMGNMSAALELLGNYDDNSSADPTVWIAYAFIYENAGDIDKAYEAAVKARVLTDISNSMSDWEKGQVYNDFARAAIFRGNDNEALRYMNLGWEKVKNTKDNRLIHVMGGNYVLRLAMSGADRTSCDKALEEYKSHIINIDAPMNQMEYMNVMLQYYRQLGDEKELYQTVRTGCDRILPQLKQKEVFRASVFRLLMNGHFERNWFDQHVPNTIDAYEQLNLIDRLAAFREYIGVFTQEEFRAVTNHEPYTTLNKTIMEYYRGNAISEIDEELRKTDSYNIYKYKELMQHKLSILKHIQGKQHIDKSEDLYVQLYKTLYDAGLHIDAVNIKLILMDECGSADNLLVITPFTPGWVYFSDFMNVLPQPPDPVLLSDGIHLSYFRLNMPPYDVKPLKDHVIKKYLDDVIVEVRGWDNHPAKIEFSIKLAHLLMCFDRRDEAKELFEIYENSSISDRQFASWLKEEIGALRTDLGTTKRVKQSQ